MISKVYAVVALMAVAVLASCAGEDNNDYIDKSIIPPGSENKTVQQAVPATNQSANVSPANTVIMPGANSVNMTPQQANAVNINPQNKTMIPARQMVTQTAAQIVTAPGMNPPHGQPGHRCDIAVGSPLNSKPATTATKVSTQQPQVTMKEIPNTQKTAPGMNPPHGEPGHRCDIAVGAPLNSKPATPATTTQVQTTIPPAVIAAPKSDSSKN